jgi:SAM-dependent methyltransferase
MTPAEYDAWYDTPRGRWIGNTELHLLNRMLDLQPGETLLDVGCGTGWFTRRFAVGDWENDAWNVTGVDRDAARLGFARIHGHGERYMEGDALELPFSSASFDCVVSVAALCCIDDWRRALAEMARVARRRVVVGVLNRHSLLWREKGRDGGRGGYPGAHWHSAGELSQALAVLPLTHVRIRTALFLPGASRPSRAAERCLPNRLPWGGFLLASADTGK